MTVPILQPNLKENAEIPGGQRTVLKDLLNAILLIDKPEGKTSHETIKETQRITGASKIGHAGTLDRFASGLLIHCTGQATKLARYLLEDDKSYSGTIKLGVSTDTHDLEGNVTEIRESISVTSENIIAAARGFTGDIVQVPPQFSALKIKGKRASDRVRRGERVTLAGRKVRINDFTVFDIDLDNSRFSFRVSCSKGTYIRSLARDMGQILGTGAYVETLRRTAAGIFSIDEAVTLPQLDEYVKGAPIDPQFIVTPVQALRNYGMMVVNGGARERILNGANFDVDSAIDIVDKGGKVFIIADEEGNLIAIADMDLNKWQIKYLNVFNMNDNQLYGFNE
jgi:tRNA pseudouridine55 synthase